MSKFVEKLALFTVTACPTGRTMGQVLAELGKLNPELVIETYYVEIHIEETNFYCIKQNPTLLFLSKEGKELQRLEGFQGTKEIQKHLEQLQEQSWQQKQEQQIKWSENVAVIEKYTIHLLQQNMLVPWEVEYRNPTGVKAPRITAIKLQLETSKAGLENPFPKNTTLELVQFDGEKGSIYLSGIPYVEPNQLQLMKQALLKTLEPYGVQDIEVLLK